jgi:hypothetical protein
MTTSIEPTALRPAVRAPFRVLAGVICLAAVVAVWGAAYMAWTGARPLRVQDVVLVPGMLWFLRLMIAATFYTADQTTAPTAAGRTTASAAAYWPFASSRVMNCYFLIVFIVCWG